MAEVWPRSGRGLAEVEPKSNLAIPPEMAGRGLSGSLVGNLGGNLGQSRGQSRAISRACAPEMAEQVSSVKMFLMRGLVSPCRQRRVREHSPPLREGHSRAAGRRRQQQTRKATDRPRGSSGSSSTPQITEQQHLQADVVGDLDHRVLRRIREDARPARALDVEREDPHRRHAEPLALWLMRDQVREEEVRLQLRRGRLVPHPPASRTQSGFGPVAVG